MYILKVIIAEMNFIIRKEGSQMIEYKRTETILAQTSREEVEELKNFMDTLKPYEKEKFIDIIKGARLVKELQVANYVQGGISGRR